MMRKLFVLVAICLLMPEKSWLQKTSMAAEANPNNSYWVFFTDKKEEGFDPFTFFDPKAIERRLRHDQSLFDPVDIPVCTAYLDSIRFFVDSVCVVSRWLNAAFVYMPDSTLSGLRGVSFVERMIPVNKSMNGKLASSDSRSRAYSRSSVSDAQMKQIEHQTGHMQGEMFRNHGFDGSRIRIAVFDAGFPGVDDHPVFSHVHKENRIVSTWDFHRNRPDVYRYNAHGTKVLSMIAGLVDSLPMGLATGADFLLARTEIWREPLAEEKYWIAAVEWADRLGADIINSSLGYYHHRYFPENMDGNSSLVAQAARVAIQKGILVINSAGNEGSTDHWRIIITPADVDSVMTVGAVEYPSLLRTSYSSLGPTADKQLKPNLVAMGDVLVAGKSGFGSARGTSFSSPLVTGFAACLWQMYPEWTNMQVFDAMQRSATLYPYYDYSHGYGVPQAGYFFNNNNGINAPTFDLMQSEGHLNMVIRQNPNKLPGRHAGDEYVFYHVRDLQGFIQQYFVIKVEQTEVLSLDLNTLTPGQQIFFHYDGYTTSWTK
jgi:serine protease AprX